MRVGWLWRRPAVDFVKGDAISEVHTFEAGHLIQVRRRPHRITLYHTPHHSTDPNPPYRSQHPTLSEREATTAPTTTTMHQLTAHPPLLYYCHYTGAMQRDTT